MTIELADGRRLMSGPVEGSDYDDWPAEEVESKFRWVLKETLEEASVENLIAAVRGLPDVDDVSDFVRAVPGAAARSSSDKRELGGSPMERMILKAWDEVDCARGHAAALKILERVGVEVRHESGLALFEKAGARVEHSRVRVPAELVEQALATAPRAFPLKGRDDDGAFDLDVRDGPVYFGVGLGLPLHPRPSDR